MEQSCLLVWYRHGAHQGAALQLCSKEISASSVFEWQLRLYFSCAVWTTHSGNDYTPLLRIFSSYTVTKFGLQSPSMSTTLAIYRSSGMVTGQWDWSTHPMRRCYGARTWSRDTFRAPDSNPVPLGKGSRGWNLHRGACRQEERQKR